MTQRQFTFFKNARYIKNPAIWIIIGYCIKGTAVTIGLLWAALSAV